MTIHQNGKVLRVNNDGSYDRRYKEGRKLDNKIVIQNNKFRSINKKVAKRVAYRKYKTVLKITVFLLGVLTAILAYAYFRLASIPNKTVLSPVKVYAESVVIEPKTLSLEDKICSYDWNCEDAKAIVKCESGWNESALAFEPNDTISVGLFQVNSIHFGKYNGIKEVINNNIEIAHKIYESRGNNFSAWSCASILGIN